MCKKGLRKIIVLLLFCSVLFSAFNVGKVLASEPAFKLTNAQIKEKSDGVNATITSYDNDSVDLNAIFYHLDDYIVYDLTLKNTTNKTYTIKSITDNNNNMYVTYIYDTYQGVVLNPNDSIVISLKSVYQTELNDINLRDQQTDVKLNILLVDENGEEVETDIGINPKTNDGLMLYVITGSLSLIGLAVITLKKYKNAKKVVITLVIFIPFITKAYTTSIVVTLSNHVRLNDKILVTKNVLGEEVQEVVSYGSKISQPADPNKEGYNFVGWYNGDAPFDFNKSYNDDVVLTAKFTLIDYEITYDYAGGNNPGNPTTYNVETEDFTLINPTLTGFNFAGWTGSNGTGLQTSVTIRKGSTGNKSYTAHFSEKDDVVYTVKHHYMDLNGTTYNEYVQTLHGVTNTTVYPEIIPRNGYNNPTVVGVQIKPDGSGELVYEYPAIPYTLTYTDLAGIDISNSTAAGIYQYGDSITVKAGTIEGYTFTSWSDGSTDSTHTFEITSDMDISANFTINTYTIQFDSQGGSNVQNKYINHGSTLGDLEIPTNPPKVFMGWYTDTTYTTEVTKDTVITSGATYYAKWSPLVCKKASNLHVEECNVTSGGCYADGYTAAGSKNTTTVTYGQLNISNTMVVGEAFDCDVNGDNTFDPIKERFYYLTTDANSNAVLIYYNNYANDDANSTLIFPYNEAGVNNLGPVTITEELPKEAVWKNTKLYSTPRQLTTNDNLTSTSDGDLIEYSYDGKSARLATTQEIESVCGVTVGSAHTGELKNCEYLLENTKYHEGSPYRYGYWLETPRSNNKVFRIAGNERFVGYVNADGNAAARPVIEVPLNLIDLTASGDYIITLHANGGGVSKTTFTVNSGDALGTLPVPTYGNNVFTGWYTSKTGGDKVTDVTVPTGNTTYYARWIPSIADATIPDNLTVVLTLNKTIEITGPSDMEGYTFRSLDDSIVTVDANGVLTGISEGTTKVIVKGTDSQLEREINITVSDSAIATITLNANGGEAVANVRRGIGDEVGTLPETSMSGKVFVGWFTSATGGDLVDKTTPVTGDVTYYAHFKDYLCIKATSNTLHEETCNRTSGGCYAANYREGKKGTTITYGTVVQNNTLKGGDALDCDVNGDGTYDPVTERFYYLTTDSNNIASLIFYDSYANGINTCNEVSGYNDNNVCNLGPVTAQTVLPTTTAWSNTKLYNNPRTLVNEEGTDKTGSLTLGTFTYENVAARLMTTQEVDAACGIQTGGSQSGELNECTFLLENTRFHDQDACRFGYWLETPKKSGSKIFRVGGESAFVGVGNANSSTGSRPVIEVPIKEIKLNDTVSHTVNFDANGGNVSPSSISVEDGAKISSMPTVSYEHNMFDGWYNGNELFDENDLITSDLNLTAKWTADVTNMTVTPTSITLTRTNTTNLTINAPENVENYSIVSSDDNIATVTNAGVVTGIGVGSTTLIITGERSGEVIVINVIVNPKQLVIAFNPDGGDASFIIAEIIEGGKISPMPTATKEHYVFDGWYWENNLVDGNTQFYQSMTLTAKWIPDVTLATVSPDSINVNKDDSVQVTIAEPVGMENYSIVSADSSIASLNGLVVTGEAVGSTSLILTGERSGQTKIVTINVLDTSHTVTFIDGTDETTETVEHGSTVTSIPELIKENYVFMGWFTNNNGTGDKLTASTIINSDITYYAYFEPIVCKAASELRETYCASNSSKGCRADGYATTDKVKFGSLVSGNTLSAGNAFDCDVNGDGVYDSDTERFYYIRTDENNNAVLLYSYNTVKTGGNIVPDSDPSYSFGTSNTSPSLTNIPTLTDWPNVSLKNSVHKILYDNLSEGVDVNYTGYAARLMSITDLNATNCNSSSTSVIKTNHCEYIYDNTGYIVESYRSYWLEIPTGASNVYRAAGSNRNIGNASYSNSTGSGVRPVIEVPLTKIDTEIHTKYTITLHGGLVEVTPNVIIVNSGESLTGLPQLNKEHYHFDGWYDDETNGNLVTTSTVPSANMDLYARWSYESSDEIIVFDPTNDAMKYYYSYIDSWKDDSSNFPSWSDNNKSPNWSLDATENTVMMQNFVNNNCECNDNQCSTGGTNKCDVPNGYDTGFNESVTVRLSDESTKTKTGAIASYANASNGVIYNLIPGEVYYWELDSDSNVYGYVKFTGERRILDATDVRNVRDLGGLEVDYNNDGVIDGHIAYGRLFRGARLTSASSATYLTNLGINTELDLRESNSDNKLSNYVRVQAQNYYVDPTTGISEEATYYQMTRDAVKKAMELIVASDDTNIYIHCRIGTDRTGTIAWVLEGLLGVNEEDRIRDYELSFFYGLVRIHRYHNQKPGSSVGTGYERFTYMHNFMPTNTDIYDWYMYGTTNRADDEDLINAFRNKMIVN